MKKYIFYFMLFYIVVNACFAEEIIIPYRINGKIGFVNEELQIVQKPKYSDIYETCKQAVEVIIRDEKSLSLKHYLYTAKYGEILIPSSKNETYSNISFIKNNYVNIKNHYSSITIDLSNLKEIESLSGLQLKSSDSIENIVVEYDSNDRSSSNSRNYLVDINGNKKLINNDFTEIRCFDSSTKIGIVRKAAKVWLINEKGEYITPKNFDTNYSFNISNGLFLGINKLEQGFFNNKGELIISINRIPELSISFICNVIPCVVENNKIDLYSKEGYYSNNWAILDCTGKIIKSNIKASEIHEYTKDGTAILRIKEKDKNKYTIIDINGNIICEEFYDEILDSINGYCMAIKDNCDYLISSIDGSIYKCSDFK